MPHLVSDTGHSVYNSASFVLPKGHTALFINCSKMLRSVASHTCHDHSQSMIGVRHSDRSE